VTKAISKKAGEVSHVRPHQENAERSHVSAPKENAERSHVSPDLSQLPQFQLAADRIRQFSLADGTLDKAAEFYLPISGGELLQGQALDQWIQHAESTNFMLMAGRGLAFLIKKTELPSNTFYAWLRDNGIPKSSAHRCMAVANMFGVVSDDVAKKIITLETHKAYALTQLKGDDESYAALEKLCSEGKLEEISPLSRQDFLAIIKQHKQAKAEQNRQDKKIDALQQRIDALQPQSVGDVPENVSAARIEVSQILFTVRDLLERLHAIVHETAHGSHLSSDPVLRARHQALIVGPLVATMRAIRAYWTEVATEIDMFEDLGDKLEDAEWLSPEESRAALERAEHVLGLYARESRYGLMDKRLFSARGK